MKLAWATDIHLNIAAHRAVETFLRSVRDSNADALLVGGDIAEAASLGRWLDALRACNKPLYFVLGNHDYYHSGIAEVRRRMQSEPGWLPNANLVELTAGSCLIGHGGWADGRLGDYAGSDVMLNDFVLIEELANLSRDERLGVLHRLGDEAAAHVRRVLSDALERYGHVVFLTHVPPFRAACWHEGQVSADDWLPHFTCKATGDVLTDFLQLDRLAVPLRSARFRSMSLGVAQNGTASVPVRSSTQTPTGASCRHTSQLSARCANTDAQPETVVGHDLSEPASMYCRWADVDARAVGATAGDAGEDEPTSNSAGAVGRGACVGRVPGSKGRGVGSLTRAR